MRHRTFWGGGDTRLGSVGGGGGGGWTGAGRERQTCSSDERTKDDAETFVVSVCTSWRACVLVESALERVSEHKEGRWAAALGDRCLVTHAARCRALGWEGAWVDKAYMFVGNGRRFEMGLYCT